MEFRVAGQAEPISHFTDAVAAAGLLFVSGIVPVDEAGGLVGGDDVVAQARQVFANMADVLATAGCSFADVVKVTVFLTDVTTARSSTPCARRCSARRGPRRRSSRCPRS